MDPRPVSRRVAAAATVVAVLLLGVLPSADAARRATASERRAMAKELTFRTACVRARVSTVNRRWAIATVRQRHGCPVGNGFFYMKRRRGGGWRSLGSDGGWNEQSPVCPDRLPERVAKDLRLCSRDA
jgi:hypothetical protein